MHQPRLLIALSLLGTMLVEQDAEAAECLTSSGKTACGYHCVASEGQVRCAQTPQGACSTASGVVACWDPPPMLGKVFERGLPHPKSVTSSGQTAFGYHCVRSDDRVLCAQTPFGACRADQGSLVCWDPPAAVVLAKRRQTPRAECLRNSGKVVCGYHCLGHEGKLRCAQTPDGICSVEQGNLVCWDPPLDSYGVTFESASELACLDAIDGPRCGFRCLATAGHSGCGTGRRDTCRAVPSGIVCQSPD